MFGVVGFFVTSIVKNIHHFNFFFTGFLSPMFFFSSVVFTIENLPDVIRPVVEIVPLTHAVRIVRALYIPGKWNFFLLYDAGYIILFILIIISQ